MHKRSKSYEPSSEMDVHRRGGNNGGATTTCDDSACGRSLSSSTTTTAQCSTVSVYRATINGVPRNVTATWTKTLINQSFTISISAAAGAGDGDSSGLPPPPPTTTMSHKVELKPWPFWSSKKGAKALAGGEIEVFWDLRSAKFPATASPVPNAGYYVAVVSDCEVVLLLGDAKKDAFKRTRSRPSASLDDTVLVSRRESVSGKRSFAARAPLFAAAGAGAGGERTREHDIFVDTWLGGREPEMRITVDGVAVVHVRSLQWKFRGNETVIVDQSPVQVLWDVHDWVFAGGAAASVVAQAVFVFKPGAPPEVGGGDNGGGGGGGIGDEGGYSFFLHAWKTE